MKEERLMKFLTRVLVEKKLLLIAVERLFVSLLLHCLLNV